MDIRFNPLNYSKSLLQTPRMLSDVAGWHEHIPFAFVLVNILKPKIFVELGTHKGDSYLAFCQSVDALSLDTKCFAVDTWMGDEHAGSYRSSLYDDLKEYNDRLYNRFSTLIKSTFHEALNQFTDKTIDLLHIDGCHTYDAVKNDFESWLPKMSESGIILLHDTSVRKGDFGVWKFWDEIMDRYPTLEFKHGNGLGVAAVGNYVVEPLDEFFSGPEEVRRAICDFFHLLGTCANTKCTIKEQALQLASLEDQINLLKSSWSWRLTAPLRFLVDIFKNRTN